MRIKRIISLMMFLLLLVSLFPVIGVAAGPTVDLKIPKEYSYDGKTSYSLSKSEYESLLKDVHQYIQDDLDKMNKECPHYESIKANEDCSVFTVVVNAINQSTREQEAEKEIFDLGLMYAAYLKKDVEKDPDNIEISYENMKGDVVRTSNYDNVKAAAKAAKAAAAVSAAAVGAAGKSSSSGSSKSSNTTTTKAQNASATEASYDWVLNTNTKKFHYPDCKSVRQMKAKNRWDYYGTRSSVIDMGYQPCGNCHP